MMKSFKMIRFMQEICVDFVTFKKCFFIFLVFWGTCSGRRVAYTRATCSIHISARYHLVGLNDDWLGDQHLTTWLRSQSEN